MYMSSESSRTILMMKWNLFFFIPQHFFHVSRGCYAYEIFFFLFNWLVVDFTKNIDYLNIFHGSIILISLVVDLDWYFYKSKQFIIRTWEEKTCYCFVTKADNKTELVKITRRWLFLSFSLVFSKKEKFFRQICNKRIWDLSGRKSTILPKRP